MACDRCYFVTCDRLSWRVIVTGLVAPTRPVTITRYKITSYRSCRSDKTCNDHTLQNNELQVLSEPRYKITSYRSCRSDKTCSSPPWKGARVMRRLLLPRAKAPTRATLANQGNPFTSDTGDSSCTDHTDHTDYLTPIDPGQAFFKRYWRLELHFYNINRLLELNMLCDCVTRTCTIPVVLGAL